ncbi:hypothetical protein D3C84_1244320 [compost metagenome]
MLGIQNICSSSVARSLELVSINCFWLSCRVMASLSTAFSSWFSRSISSPRVVSTSVRCWRSAGVRFSSGFWANWLSM